MNVGQAKAALSRYGFDSGDPLNAWLEAAKQDFLAAYDWPYLQVTVDPFPVAVGDNLLDMPTDYFKLHALRYKGDPTTGAGPGRKLKYKDLVGFDRDVDNPDATGAPEWYIPRGESQIQIYPVPSIATNLKLVYQQDLADINALSDGDPMPGPIATHYIIVIGGAYIGLQAESEEDRSQTAQAMFESGIAREVRRYKGQIDEARQVVDVMGYGNH